MKTAIVGSRSFTSEYEFVINIARYNITHIISGGAIGADTLAEEYADTFGIPKTIIKPEWSKFGRVAGFVRNKQIVDSCEQLIAFWDGYSKGTADTITYARKKLHKDNIHIILV